MLFRDVTFLFLIMNLYDIKIYQAVILQMIHLSILQVRESGGTSTCDSNVNPADGCNTGI